jgi:hypothetical protein
MNDKALHYVHACMFWAGMLLDGSWRGLAGVLTVKRVRGVPTVFPAEDGHVRPEENLLQVVYDHGPVKVRLKMQTASFSGLWSAWLVLTVSLDGTLAQNEWKLFSDLRQQIAEEWRALPKVADPVSEPLKHKVHAVGQKHGRQL